MKNFRVICARMSGTKLIVSSVIKSPLISSESVCPVKKENKKTIVNGAKRYETKQTATESDVFPLTISVNAGTAMPGGIDASSKNAMADSPIGKEDTLQQE